MRRNSTLNPVEHSRARAVKELMLLEVKLGKPPSHEEIEDRPKLKRLIEVAFSELADARHAVVLEYARIDEKFDPHTKTDSF